ncbi:Acyl-CoA N-acyltransferase [Penicillium psychrosexuale]|uniref:Acyl-CoA N-acyltransferase n=1 Tax=Penicillium psychrosexuale TaxID=1002107 RepID=UPI00254566C3|nr:Acyl-CoA N-acyltransferase [Penicillium psychrosexuale]KAJ5800480.1 Acyl-CoA N-acyltransferase [Penicillium psychrosexuale]
MAPNCTYSFLRVSKTDGVEASAQKYRDLRLKALKASPESFSSTYAIESTFTDASWVNRLISPDRELFICAATPVSEDSSSPNGIQWIGQVTMLRAFIKSPTRVARGIWPATPEVRRRGRSMANAKFVYPARISRPRTRK